MNIKQKLVSSFVVVMLVSTVAVISVYHSRMTDAIYDSYKYNAKSNAEAIIKTVISKMLETSSNYVEFLSQDSELVRSSYYATVLGDTQDLELLLPAYRDRLGLTFLQLKSLEGKKIISTQEEDLGDYLSDPGKHKATIDYEKYIGQFIVHSSDIVTRNKKDIGVLEGGYILDQKFLSSLVDENDVIAIYNRRADSYSASKDIGIAATWIKKVFGEVESACLASISSQLCVNPPYQVLNTVHEGVPYILVATSLKLTSAMPVGTVVIAHNAVQMERELSKARNITLLVSLGSIIVALVIATTLAQGLSTPIRKLKNAALALGKGDMNVRVDISTKDEVGVLANAFNQIGKELSGTTVSKDYIENILRSMVDALIVLDQNRCIERVNGATEKMFGVKEAELSGLGLDHLIRDKDLLKLMFDKLEREEKISNFDATIHLKEEDPVQVSISGAYLRDLNKHPVGTVFVAKDMSERIGFIRELERTNKQLDQFAYVVSHDLKAPLRAIANLSEWIEEDVSDFLTDDTRKQMDLLRGRVRRMEGLINGILDYSRIGRIEYEPERVDVQKLLNEIVDSMPVPEAMIINIEDNMPLMNAPRVPLSQVFSNLISNAIKYRSHDNARADVSVQDHGSYFEFTVSDDGIGIDPKFHDKVFGMFQTLAARDKVESTGVGLCMVKRIVEEQGGTIVLESEEGQGSTFKFTWPKQLS